VIVAPVPPALDLAVVPPRPEQVAEGETALAERAVWVKEAGVPCETVARFGNPADQLLARAQELQPRLMVVGTRGQGALRRALIGSVAERIIHHARCPVLVVPEVG
jgi:nucleotide-binding universal stress UspA family protein